MAHERDCALSIRLTENMMSNLTLFTLSSSKTHLERLNQQFGSLSAPTLLDPDIEDRHSNVDSENEVRNFCNGKFTLHSNWPQVEKKCKDGGCMECYCNEKPEVVFRKPLCKRRVGKR